MIEVRHVTKKYGKFVALDDINFKIKDHEVVGFLGPNGAGKTTTMNILAGYIESDKGNVIIDGYDINRYPKKAKENIGYMPESVPLYSDLTVKEFVKYMAELKNLKGLHKKSEVEKVIEETGLTSVENKLIRNISRGYKQRTGLAGALIGNPDVLILDEPTVGLDPKQIAEIRALIKSLGKKHTVILSSHILSEVSQICERVIIINEGKIIAQDTPQKLEKLTLKQNGVLVTVEDKKDKMKTIAKSYKNITEVKLIKKLDDGTKNYEISSEEKFNLSRAVLDFTSKNDINVIELRKIENTLEDAFLLLIKEKENERKKEETEQYKKDKAREERLTNMTIVERDKALKEEYEEERKREKEELDRQLEIEKEIDKEEKARLKELKREMKEKKAKEKAAKKYLKDEMKAEKQRLKEQEEKRLINRIKEKKNANKEENTKPEVIENKEKKTTATKTTTKKKTSTNKPKTTTTKKKTTATKSKPTTSTKSKPTTATKKTTTKSTSNTKKKSERK